MSSLFKTLSSVALEIWRAAKYDVTPQKYRLCKSDAGETRRFPLQEHARLFDEMPCIWLKPAVKAEEDRENNSICSYNCPLYKTSLRVREPPRNGSCIQNKRRLRESGLPTK